MGGELSRSEALPAHPADLVRVCQHERCKIQYWFRMLKAGATKEQWEYIHDLTFHDLRHDFAHRAREGGWSLEEVAYYLGHVTKKGLPAIQTTVRYTQVSRVSAILKEDASKVREGIHTSVAQKKFLILHAPSSAFG
jgi:integrase